VHLNVEAMGRVGRAIVGEEMARRREPGVEGRGSGEVWLERAGALGRLVVE
jgi:hypothetical protein